jgi:hypothetical protein
MACNSVWARGGHGGGYGVGATEAVGIIAAIIVNRAGIPPIIPIRLPWLPYL